MRNAAPPGLPQAFVWADKQSGESIVGMLHPGGYGGTTVADAVMADVEVLGGTGGVIVVSPFGPAVFSFNTEGMYRGRATSDGMNEVAIYDDEK